MMKINLDINNPQNVRFPPELRATLISNGLADGEELDSIEKAFSSKFFVHTLNGMLNRVSGNSFRNGMLVGAITPVLITVLLMLFK